MASSSSITDHSIGSQSHLGQAEGTSESTDKASGVVQKAAADGILNPQANAGQVDRHRFNWKTDITVTGVAVVAVVVVVAALVHRHASTHGWGYYFP